MTQLSGRKLLYSNRRRKAGLASWAACRAIVFAVSAIKAARAFFAATKKEESLHHSACNVEKCASSSGFGRLYYIYAWEYRFFFFFRSVFLCVLYLYLHSYLFRHFCIFLPRLFVWCSGLCKRSTHVWHCTANCLHYFCICDVHPCPVPRYLATAGKRIPL